MNSSVCKVAFLDRDGTINVDHGYVHQRADWQLIDRVAEAIALLRGTGFRIAVVTNQSGIASGKYTEADVDLLHTHMRSQLVEAGVPIDAIAVCPHASDGDCKCRKPKIGMANDIASQLNQPINYEQSWMIGDKLSDIGFWHCSRNKHGLDPQQVLARRRSDRQTNIDCRLALRSG